MKLGQLISVMEKTGWIRFESTREKEGFVKIAQGMPMPMGMGMDPAMMQQGMGAGGQMPMDPSMMQGGMDPSMMDPSMMDPSMMDPSMMQGQPAQPGLPQPGSEESIIGESITNSDIESLLKIINIVSSLKSKYDGMKKEQMEMLKSQAEGVGPAGAGAPPMA